MTRGGGRDEERDGAHDSDGGEHQRGDLRRHAEADTRAHRTLKRTLAAAYSTLQYLILEQGRSISARFQGGLGHVRGAVRGDGDRPAATRPFRHGQRTERSTCTPGGVDPKNKTPCRPCNHDIMIRDEESYAMGSRGDLAAISRRSRGHRTRAAGDEARSLPGARVARQALLCEERLGGVHVVDAPLHARWRVDLHRHATALDRACSGQHT